MLGESEYRVPVLEAVVAEYESRAVTPPSSFRIQWSFSFPVEGPGGRGSVPGRLPTPWVSGDGTPGGWVDRTSGAEGERATMDFSLVSTFKFSLFSLGPKTAEREGGPHTLVNTPATLHDPPVPGSTLTTGAEWDCV